MREQRKVGGKRKTPKKDSERLKRQKKVKAREGKKKK